MGRQQFGDIPVTGHGGPWGCEMSRLPHFLDTWLTDGGEVVSLMRQLPFTPRKILGTHLCIQMNVKAAVNELAGVSEPWLGTDPGSFPVRRD
jgi:hypothetical protein